MKRKLRRKRLSQYKSRAAKTDGSTSLLAGGAAFAVVGGLLVWKPMAYHGTGGIGRYGQRPVNFVYEPSTMVGFGVFFLLIAGFLMWAGLPHRRK